MELIFIRHGEDDGRYRGGHSNIDLTPRGEAQAKQLAQFLYDNREVYNISHIISSDLPRAMSTAQFISAELKIPIISDSRIREMNNGDLAGMLNEEAEIKYPNLFFSTLDMDEPYPNGESPNEFFNRIKVWFTSILATSQRTEGNTCVVTHGGVINIIYHIVKNIPWSNKGTAFPVSNCSIHIVDAEKMDFKIENRVITK